MHTCRPPLIVGLANGAPRMDLTVIVALLGRAGRRRQALCNGASPTIPRLRHRLSFAEAGPATVRSPTGWGAPALNKLLLAALCFRPTLRRSAASPVHRAGILGLPVPVRRPARVRPARQLRAPLGHGALARPAMAAHSALLLRASPVPRFNRPLRPPAPSAPPGILAARHEPSPAGRWRARGCALRAPSHAETLRGPPAPHPTPCGARAGEGDRATRIRPPVPPAALLGGGHGPVRVGGSLRGSGVAGRLQWLRPWGGELTLDDGTVTTRAAAVHP